MSLLSSKLFQPRLGISFGLALNRYKNIKMNSLVKLPDSVRGITVLDKKLFERNIEVPIFVLNDVNLSSILPTLKKYLLKVQRFKPIEHINEVTKIYLNPVIIKQWDSFPEDVQKKLNSVAVYEKNLQKVTYTFKYDNYTAEDIFRAVLPNDKEGLSSFTRVGHIVHVNLREHLLPFKNIIGEVLFDKVHGCKTVVNKANIIDNTYRSFSMEVLKGDTDMATTVKENNCTFKFDFSTVYWNSRLCTEHERIVKQLQSGDVLFDVFAGVGPFSVPAGRKKCTVFANDLNPESFKWLKHNFESNKVDQKYYKLFNKDGNDFIREEVRQYLPQYLNKNNIYITMNLPALALQFLNSFVGLFTPNELPNTIKPPIVFVYCFAKGEDYMKITKESIKQIVQCDLSDKIIDIFKVRTVSSLKEMMRITVSLDRDILVSDRKRRLEDELESENKKVNLGDHGQKQEEIK